MNNIIKSLCNLNYYNPIGLHIANYVIDNNKNLILHYAIDDNNIILCKYLLDDIKIISYPLLFSYIIQKNNNELIKLFINYINPNINIFNEINSVQETLLCHSTYNNNYELSQFLIYNNININGYDISYNKKINNTPLYNAVVNNNYKLVKLLLKNNADPNIWSHTGYGDIGELPLHAAIYNNNYKICKLLILFEADPLLELTISSKYGYNKFESPLQIVLNDLVTKFKFLKLFQHYNNVLNRNEYLILKYKNKKNRY